MAFEAHGKLELENYDVLSVLNSCLVNKIYYIFLIFLMKETAVRV